MTTARLAVWPFFRPPGKGWQWHVSALVLATIAIVCGAIRFDVFGPAGKVKLALDSHAIIQFEEALILTLCGKYGFFGAAGPPLAREQLPPDLPFVELLAAKHGSVEQYCERNSAPMLMNENSLFLLAAALLAFPPQDTARTFAVKMIAFRCALTLAALYVLAVFGVGIIPLAVISFASSNAFAILQQWHLISMYPTMSVLPLVSGVLSAIALTAFGRGGIAKIVAVGLGTGIAWALIYNFRTSYGFAMALQLVTAFALHMIWTRPRPLRSYLGMLAGIAVGFAVFQAIFIWPLQRVPSGYHGRSYAYHVIWHPMVLGLALPHRSALAEREGIRWEDAAGKEIAQRIDPSTYYLGPTYDATLRSYYFNLWKKHPYEMLTIYNAKIEAFGKLVIDLARAVIRIDIPGDLWSIPESRYKITLNGYLWFGMLSIALVFAFLAYPVNAPLSALAAVLTVALLYLSVEQALIIPIFMISRQAALPVCLAALCAVYSAFAAMLLLKLAGGLGAPRLHRTGT